MNNFNSNEISEGEIFDLLVKELEEQFMDSNQKENQYRQAEEWTYLATFDEINNKEVQKKEKIKEVLSEVARLAIKLGRPVLYRAENKNLFANPNKFSNKKIETLPQEDEIALQAYNDYQKRSENFDKKFSRSNNQIENNPNNDEFEKYRTELDLLLKSVDIKAYNFKEITNLTEACKKITSICMDRKKTVWVNFQWIPLIARYVETPDSIMKETNSQVFYH